MSSAWDLHSIQKLEPDFIPLYPKDNNKIFVIRTYKTWDEKEKVWKNLRIETEIKYLEPKSVVDDLTSNDMMVVNVIYTGPVDSDNVFRPEQANVDYDVNFLSPNKLYYVTVGGQNHGFIYRPDKQEIENLVTKSSTTKINS